MQNNSEKTTTTSDSGHKADPIEFTRSLAALSDKRIDILRRIKETGSISEAARASGVSYKAAWQALETLENLAGGKLVEKLVGGNRGGGTTLTVTGEQILKIADRTLRPEARCSGALLMPNSLWRTTSPHPAFFPA